METAGTKSMGPGTKGAGPLEPLIHRVAIRLSRLTNGLGAGRAPRDLLDPEAIMC